MNTNEAFETLLENVNDELEKTQKVGADFFARGKISQVRKIADRMEELQSLMKQVHELQDRFNKLIPASEAGMDTIHKLPPGVKTNLKQYRLPILQVLVEMGGSALVDQVLVRVQEVMSDRLNDIDYQLLPSRKEVRWRNTAKWERWSMVQDGLLNKDAPYGTWEITEKGREMLNKS